jgi:hypothetical protein
MCNLSRFVAAAAAASTFALAAPTGAAASTTFDFVGPNDGPGIYEGFLGSAPAVFTDGSDGAGGINIVGATGGAYIDNDYGNYGPSDDAGLGACPYMGGCEGSSADDIGFGDSVTLTFSEAVSLSMLTFNSGDNPAHGPLNGTVGIDGVNVSVVNGFATFVTDFLTTHTFSYVSWCDDFYVGSFEASVVPLPAPLLLLLSGLGGLGLIGYRKRSVA